MNLMMADVRVGVGTLIFSKDKIFLAKRKASHADGYWGSTGGHLEFGESFKECAIREANEEFGLTLSNLHYLCVSNVIDYDVHYVDIEFMCQLPKDQKPQIKEPEKFYQYGWFDLDKLPKPLFMPIQYAIKSYIEGIYFWDSSPNQEY